MNFQDFAPLAPFALLIPLWGHVKAVFERIRSLLLKRVTVNGDAAMKVFNYLHQHAKFLPASDTYLGSLTLWVRPLGRMTEVLAYRAPLQPLVGLLGAVPVFVNGSKGSQEDTSPADWIITITTVRGTLDTTKLLKDALEWSLGVSTEGKRYRVRKVRSGGETPGGFPRARHSEVYDASTNFLHWRREDIGEPKPEHPFTHYILTDETSRARDDFRQWVNSRQWYASKGIPWRRGHLYHGVPGTGKTSLVRAVAQEADIPVFAFDLSTLSNNDFIQEWTDMRSATPCVALIEDIDGVFHGRQSVVQPTNTHQPLTFDCLLNAISGVDAAEGVFLVVTTNNVSLVDEALGAPLPGNLTSRPGRLDRHYEFTLPTLASRRAIMGSVLDTVTPEDVEATDGLTSSQVVEYAVNKALQAHYP